jgi:hypothetical protein
MRSFAPFSKAKVGIINETTNITVYPNYPGFTTDDTILVCFEATLITPDSYVETLAKIAYLAPLGGGDSNDNPAAKRLFEQTKPIVLKKTIGVFD